MKRKKAKSNRTSNTKILAVDISPEIFQLLEDCKKNTGATKRYIIEKAIKAYCEKERKE